MPQNYGYTVRYAERQTHRVAQSGNVEAPGEQIMYTSQPQQWLGFDIVRSCHHLKRLHLDLQKHTIMHRVGSSSQRQVWQGTQLTQGAVVPGNCGLFGAGKDYNITFGDGAQEEIYAVISPAYLNSVAQDASNKPVADVDLVWCNNLTDPFLSHVVQAFDIELRSGCPGGKLLGESLGMALAIYLLKHHATVTYREPAPMQQLSSADLRRVRDLVRTRLSADLSVAELAESVHLSQYHFSRLFRAATQMSPYQFVLHERIETAKEMLQHGDTPLAQIALCVGFANQSHFSRHFKKFVGVAPSELRRSTMWQNNRTNGKE